MQVIVCKVNIKTCKRLKINQKTVMSMQTRSHGKKDELQTVECEVTAPTEDYSDQSG